MQWKSPSQFLGAQGDASETQRCSDNKGIEVELTQSDESTRFFFLTINSFSRWIFQTKIPNFSQLQLLSCDDLPFYFVSWKGIENLQVSDDLFEDMGLGLRKLQRACFTIFLTFYASSKNNHQINPIMNITNFLKKVYRKLKTSCT